MSPTWWQLPPRGVTLAPFDRQGGKRRGVQGFGRGLVAPGAARGPPILTLPARPLLRHVRLILRRGLVSPQPDCRHLNILQRSPGLQPSPAQPSRRTPLHFGLMSAAAVCDPHSDINHPDGGEGPELLGEGSWRDLGNEDGGDLSLGHSLIVLFHHCWRAYGGLWLFHINREMLILELFTYTSWACTVRPHC